ncbi:MAG: hypothetical protein KDA75_00875 [Planctomycetaceae bacterium]|nr:hypothetical protein [Planctomycetaceae bacterium]
MSVSTARRLSPTEVRIVAALGLVTLFVLAGCGLGGNEQPAEPEIPDWVSTDAAKPSEPSSQLALHLRAGDRFPLRKVIEKEVVQEAPGSAPQVHRLRIELTLGMTVDEVRDGKTRFRVKYDRVKYVHHLPDEVIEYDSAAPPANLPLSIRAWHTMVGDGFAFWVGRDNQIADVEGFEDFLKRCLSSIPPDRRDEVLMSIESSSGENGVADFVDNAIGLLPYGEIKSAGQSWERTRHIGRPVPMVLDNTYTLKELNDQRAVVQINGKITPSTTLMDTPREDMKKVRMTVRSGDTWGECTLFRDTGLPERSRVEHQILMTVHMTGGREFEQRVRGATTIEAFPTQIGAATVIGPK